MQAAWEQPPPPAYAASIIESEAFPALHAEGGPAVRSKRKVGFTGKAKANKKPALKTEAAGETERPEDMEMCPDKGRNLLVEKLEQIQVTETSLHPYRHVEDLIKARPPVFHSMCDVLEWILK